MTKTVSSHAQIWAFLNFSIFWCDVQSLNLNNQWTACSIELKFYTKVRHGSYYIRAKSDVISRPNTAAMAKDANFCILDIFLYIRPMIFLTFGWRKITKFCTQEWMIGFYLHAKFCRNILSCLGDIAKKTLVFGEFSKHTVSNPF